MYVLCIQYLAGIIHCACALCLLGTIILYDTESGYSNPRMCVCMCLCFSPPSFFNFTGSGSLLELYS
jgi:hypothetical protein